MAPQSFTLHVPDTAIADLKTRLGLTRFPDAAPGEPWAFGSSVAYVRDLVGYWKDDFDWRTQEAALNAFPQYKVPLHDIDVHYLHVPGVGPNPYPLLLMHGWPGSVYEFLDIIPRLTDPARFGGDPRDAFTVIAPSLPGYGLSFKPGQKRFILQDMAACLHDLMTDVLGFEKFAVQGGDWGGGIASIIGQAYPSSVCGIHVNLLFAPRDPAAGGTTPEEEQYFKTLRHWLKEETGYQQIQGTKPQTLAFADGFARRPRRLDRGKIPLLVGLRRGSGKRHQPRPDAGEYRALLVHRRDRIFVLALLRPRAFELAALAGAARDRSDRLCGFPERNHRAAALDRGENLHQHSALDRDEERRPFRRHGAARGVGRGNPAVFSNVAVKH